MNLQGKTILITGASSGIGKELAKELFKENSNLVLVARRTELIEEYLNKPLITNNQSPITKDQPPITKNQSLIIKCDVSKKSEVIESFKFIKQKYGGVDIAILNAGFGHYMNAENYNSEFAEKIYGTNLIGMIYWIEQILPDFIKKRDGVIAGVSSLADNRGYSKSSFYSSSKAAVTNYLEGLRVELKAYNINVVTIRPGFVETPMTSGNKFNMPFLMRPEKAAKIIINGLKKEKRIIQFPWQMVILTKIVGNIPGRIYEWVATRTDVNKRK